MEKGSIILNIDLRRSYEVMAKEEASKNNIIKKTCEQCEMDYPQNMEYCPNCGSKNSSFKKSDKVINDFKNSIENNTFFKSKLNKELKKIQIFSICPKCGAKNNMSSNFCTQCGVRL